MARESVIVANPNPIIQSFDEILSLNTELT